MASAVTRAPRALARRMMSTEKRDVMCWRWTCAPVLSERMTLRATMMSSAACGQPRRPRRVDIAPSFITAPTVIEASWQWSMIGRSNIFAYSRARRMSSLLCTQSPSSVMATTPARLSEPMGARAVPFIPTVMQPVG